LNSSLNLLLLIMASLPQN